MKREEFAKKLGVEDISNIPDKLEIPNYEEILKHYYQNINIEKISV